MTVMVLMMEMMGMMKASIVDIDSATGKGEKKKRRRRLPC